MYKPPSCNRTTDWEKNIGQSGSNVMREGSILAVDRSWHGFETQTSTSKMTPVSRPEERLPLSASPSVGIHFTDAESLVTDCSKR